MCLVAIVWQVAEDAPLVLGANREEFYARGGDPPRRLAGVDAVGGVDPTHGGTWLGVNAHGLLVAVTNRYKSRLPEQPRSRGLLARDLLACASASSAVEHCLQALNTGAVAGCNFLLADRRDAVVVHAGDWLRVQPLPAGVHVLANRDVNDPTDPRVGYAGDWLSRQPLRRADDVIAALRHLCASHAPPEAPVCFHGEHRGSVSSSILALRVKDRRGEPGGSLADSTYLHAQGPPDRTPYQDISDLLAELSPRNGG